MGMNSLQMLDGATSTGASESFEPNAPKRSFQASGITSAGAGAATVEIQVSNDNSNFITMGTISLTLSTSAAVDGFTSDAPWRYVRANITAISGTDAAVDVFMANGEG